MIALELLLNGKPVQGSAADNATATVTVGATPAVRHFVCGIYADYSAAVALLKTVTLKFGSATAFVWRWDFSKGPFLLNLALPFHGDYNEAVSVELEASGTGAVTGRAGIAVASR